MEPVDYTKLTPNERRACRLKYIEYQNNICMYCNEDLLSNPPPNILSKKINWSKFPKGFLDYPIHLQHNHKTRMTEGAVHAYCNAVMWQYHGR
jgi:hypothetical protein